MNEPQPQTVESDTAAAESIQIGTAPPSLGADIDPVAAEFAAALGRLEAAGVRLGSQRVAAYMIAMAISVATDGGVPREVIEDMVRMCLDDAKVQLAKAIGYSATQP